jgi:hypothetical protein
MSSAYRYVNGIIDIQAEALYRRHMVDDKDPRIITPIPKLLLTRIDDYRFENRLPSRSEAIRRLIEAGLSKASTATPSGGGESGEPDKPAGSVAPAPKKPTERKAEPAAPLSKEAQIRALREQGAR